MTHARSAALLIMPLLLLSASQTEAQMSAIGIGADGIAALRDAAASPKLYLSADDGASGTGVAGASSSAEEKTPVARGENPSAPVENPAATAAPTPGAAAPVTLPPQPKRVRDLPDLQPGDRIHPFRAAAFGLTASTLGAGAEVAVPIARRLNVRVGGSYLNLHYPFNQDGIDYAPGAKFTAGQATIDWFPHGGAFHISVGALYFRNHIAGSAAVVEGQSFTLGDTVYTNSVDDPVGGTASVAYGKQVAPLVLLGFGNLLPRNGRHFSMPIEFGGAYMKAPKLNLQLSGTACTSQGCFDAATSAEVQANLKAEETKLQSDLKLLQVYPVVSIGLACRF